MACKVVDIAWCVCYTLRHLNGSWGPGCARMHIMCMWSYVIWASGISWTHLHTCDSFWCHSHSLLPLVDVAWLQHMAQCSHNGDQVQLDHKHCLPSAWYPLLSCSPHICRQDYYQLACTWFSCGIKFENKENYGPHFDSLRKIILHYSWAYAHKQYQFVHSHAHTQY